MQADNGSELASGIKWIYFTNWIVLKGGVVSELGYQVITYKFDFHCYV